MQLIMKYKLKLLNQVFNLIWFLHLHFQPAVKNNVAYAPLKENPTYIISIKYLMKLSLRVQSMTN